MSPTAAAIHDPIAMRRAGRELLSLALIDARNRTLRWLSAFSGAGLAAARSEFDPPLWLIGHVGWFQECAIARNVQRARGGRSRAPPLASIEPRADAWFDPTVTTREQRWRDTDVSDPHLRDYLAATLDTTLELLERTEESDAGLQLFRLALANEDTAIEMLAATAQACGLGASAVKELWPIWPSRVRREPLWFAAQRFALGSPRGGFVPDNEQWATKNRCPSSRSTRSRCSGSSSPNSPKTTATTSRPCGCARLAWVERQGRRAPRYVEQLGRAVLAQRGGQLQRVAAAQAVAHVSWYEADAWCRWAARRLPTELEWELAVIGGATRGFVWGDVREWVSGRPGRWSDEPVAATPPWAGDVPTALWPSYRVARGASVLTVPRLKHPRARTFASPECDTTFVGFRSCSL